MRAPFASRPSLLAALAATLLAGCGGGGSHGGSGGDSTAPTITAQPTSVTAPAGGTATFTVATSASGATYQWYKGTTPVSGATGATYTIASLTADSAGTYFCRVSIGSKSTDSATATLTIGTVGAPTITTQPQSLTVAPGGEAEFHVIASGANLTYQWSKDGVALAGATSPTYTIATVSAASVGNYSVHVANSLGSADSAPAALALGSASAPAITGQPRSQTIVAGGTASFTVTATGSGLTYQWYLDGAPIAGATGAGYTIVQAGTGAAGDYTVVVKNSVAASTSAAATLTVVTKPVITMSPTSLTTDPGQSVSFSGAATGADLSYQWYKNSTAIPGATSSMYTIASVAKSDQASYSLNVTNLAGITRSGAASLTVVDAPSITSGPGSVTRGVGSTATFTVAFSSLEPVAYQWYKGTTAITGASGTTSAATLSYTTPATTTTDNGTTYSVTLTNGAGTTTSATATLTVDSAPTLTTQPASTSVVQPNTATFTVVATASGALSYQWYRNGVKISGATDASYTTAATSVSADNGAKFYVVVSNDGLIGTTSATATLTVTSS